MSLVSKAKAQGTAVETAAATWLRENGFPETERLALCGAQDKGDLRLSRSPLVIAECKRGKRGVRLTPWMRELRVEIQNAGAEAGILISDQPGAGARRVEKWFSAMDYSQFVYLSGGDAESVYVDLVQVSPMRMNSDYVPLLVGDRAPLAVTYTPGDMSSRMVCGPLWKMLEFIRQ